MRQFTDISVSKWDDPRASALTSYSISPSQAKTSRYRRVLGSAPFRQTYEICSDDSNEESAGSSEDEKNSADTQPTEEGRKEAIPEDEAKGKSDEPTVEKEGKEEANTSAKESEESKQEAERAVDEPDVDNNDENSEKPPTSTDDKSGGVEDISSKNITKKKEQDDSQNESAEGAEGSDASAATEEESGGLTAPERPTSNESGTGKPDQVTNGAASDTTQEDRAKVENSAQNTADDKQEEKEEVKPSESAVNEEEATSPAEATESRNDNVTQKNEVAAETSTGKLEDVKSEDNDGEAAKSESKAHGTDDALESQPDIAKTESSARNISFAANVKDPKLSNKSSKSKKKKSLGKKKASSVSNPIPKTEEETTTTSATASNGSDVKSESAPDESKAEGGNCEETTPAVAKWASKSSERKKSLSGKQLNKKEKKSNKKKADANKDGRKAVEGRSTDTTREESTTADGTSTAVNEAQFVDQSGEGNTSNETSEKNDEESKVQEKTELADDENGGKSDILETTQEDKTFDEKVVEPVTTDNIDGEGKADYDQPTEKSEDANVENDKDKDAEKLSVTVEPSSEDNQDSNLSTAKLNEEIGEKGPGGDEANKDTVTESEGNENIPTRNVQETGQEDNDQITDKAAEDTAISNDVSNKEDTSDNVRGQVAEAVTAEPELEPEPGEQSQSDRDKAKEIREAKPKSTAKVISASRKKSSKRDKSGKEISSIELTETAKDGQADSHIQQEGGLKKQSSSFYEADTKKANFTVKEESVKEVKADTDNCKTIESLSSKPCPKKDEPIDGAIDADAADKSQNEEDLISEISIKHNVSTSEGKIAEGPENAEPAITEANLATDEDAGEAKVTEMNMSEASESLAESSSEKEWNKEDPRLDKSDDKDTLGMVENVSQPVNEVPAIKEIEAEEQPSPTEASGTEMNVEKDEDVHEEKLEEDGLKAKDQAPAEEDKLVEKQLGNNIESLKEKEENPVEGQEKSVKQPDEEKIEMISNTKETQLEEALSDEQEKTAENIVPGNEDSDSLDITTRDRDQHSSDKVKENKEDLATEKKDSFVIEKSSEVFPDDKESGIIEVKTNDANPNDPLDSSSNVDDKPEKNNPKSQMENSIEVNTPCESSEDKKVNHDKIDIVEETENNRDSAKQNEDQGTPNSVDQVEETEVSPETEPKMDNPEKSCEIAYNKAGEGNGESHSSENIPTNLSDEAEAEPQNEDIDTGVAANQTEHTINDDKPTQAVESDNSTSSDVKDIQSETLKTDNVKLKTESASPDTYVTGFNKKEKKKGQASSKKPRRSSEGSFLSMNTSNRSRRDSHGSKAITDKRKSKSKSVENEKDREEKRKRREAKKDEEIRFLRKELARYEERQKHDQEERRHKRDLEKRTEINSAKATKRSSYDTEGDKKYIQSDSQKVETRREKVSIDESGLERKSKNKNVAPSEGKDNELSPLESSTKLKSSKEERDIPAEKQAMRLPSNQQYRRHSESYRGYRDSRLRSARPIDASSKEKKTLHSSGFDEKAALGTDIRPPPLSPTLDDMNSTTKVDNDVRRDREIRRSRRSSYKTSSRDKRKNSFHGKDKEDVSILAAGKSLFSGIKNALAKA